MTGSAAVDDGMWEGFVMDAGTTLRAQRGFEDAVARTLESPFDPVAQQRVATAVAELAAATPAAHRLAQLQPNVGIS